MPLPDNAIFDQGPRPRLHERPTVVKRMTTSFGEACQPSKKPILGFLFPWVDCRCIKRINGCCSVHGCCICVKCSGIVLLG